MKVIKIKIISEISRSLVNIIVLFYDSKLCFFVVPPRSLTTKVEEPWRI